MNTRRMSAHVLALLCILTCTFIWSSAASAEPMAAVTVSGSAYLAGRSDHSGVKVLFSAASGSAVTDSAYTDVNGDYIILLQEGNYDITFSSAGYIDYTMVDEPVLGLTILGDVTLVSAAQILSGNIEGTLSSGLDYFISSNVTIPFGDTLIIEPGVTVYFEGAYKVFVYGLLIAQGTESDSISFTPAEGVSYWDKIQFYNSSNDNSVISYCRFDNSYGVTCEAASPDISHCYMLDMHGGIAAGYSSNPTITDCVIINCGQAGIHVNDSSSPVISGCTVENGYPGFYFYGGSAEVSGCTAINCDYDNTSGFRMDNYFSGTITDCSSTDNYYGFYCYNSSPAISGCTITGNTYGVVSGSGSSPSVDRCTFYGNSTAMRLGSSNATGSLTSSVIRGSFYGFMSSTYVTTYVISHNDFYGNTEDFYATNPAYYLPTGIGELAVENPNGDSTDVYYNMMLDPLQADAAGGDYTLLSSSPCIDAGDPALPYDPDGTIADIGAYPYFQGSPPPAPVADFSASQISGYQPLPVIFTNLTTGAVTEYQWNFGDGTISSQFEPGHFYTVPGTYSVSLTATGPGGVDVEIKAGHITVLPSSSPPEPDFAADHTSGYAPLEVSFVNFTTGEADSFKWYFGDGDSSTAAEPSHVYSAPGIYDVELVAYSSYGTGVETKASYIAVLAPPAIMADFSAVPLEGMAPHGVVFTDASSGIIDTWHWEFGDGDTSNVANPIHLYDEPGSYDVTLTVSGGGSDSETKEGYINVYVESPVIDLITDVPADQGGWAYLHFTGSWYDRVSETVQPVDEYAVYRRIDGAAAAANMAEKGETLISGSPAAETLPPGLWAVVLNVPATQSSGYIALVPTIADSSASYDYSVFVVGAFTTTPSVFFYSEPDSGYSVDDLSPAPPAMVTGEPVYIPSPGLDLSWNANTEGDLSHYAVYRGLDSDFVPAPGNLLGTPSSNAFFDGGWVWTAGYWYKVAAIDIHGNESDHSVLGPAEITGDDQPGPPVQDYLAQNFPNPFNPSTTIQFGLSRNSHVSLKIFDTTGRLVRVVVEEYRPAGHYRELWDGLNSRGVPVSSGMYYYRLVSPDCDKTCKMILLR